MIKLLEENILMYIEYRLLGDEFWVFVGGDDEGEDMCGGDGGG